MVRGFSEAFSCVCGADWCLEETWLLRHGGVRVRDGIAQGSPDPSPLSFQILSPCANLSCQEVRSLVFLSVDVFRLRSMEVFREGGASFASLYLTANLGPWISALSTSQQCTGEHLPFLDMDLKGSLPWEPRAILTFRAGASSWISVFCSPSEVTESGPRTWQLDRAASIGPGPQGPTSHHVRREVPDF